jgi:hypothetical protein
MDASLLADFIGGNPIKLFVPFDGNHSGTICVDRVVGTFSQQIKSVLLKVPNEVTSLDRHAEPLWATAQ